MPKKGRPRTVTGRSLGTKLFVDDLREVVKLAAVDGRTLSDQLRELVHEALLHRRLRSIGRDQEEAGIHEPLAEEIRGEFKALREWLGRRGSANDMLPATDSILREILGFAMTAELKSHLLLYHFLTSRGMSEETVQKSITEHENRTRQNLETILSRIEQLSKETRAAK